MRSVPRPLINQEQRANRLEDVIGLMNSFYMSAVVGAATGGLPDLIDGRMDPAVLAIFSVSALYGAVRGWKGAEGSYKASSLTAPVAAIAGSFAHVCYSLVGFGIGSVARKALGE